MSRVRARHLQEHLTVLALYGLIAIGVSWPLARDAATRVVGDVNYDQRHTIWLLWHVKEAVLGRQPFFTADLLFYPHGVSTLIDGVGALNGLLALPFWTWGPAAAYNGAALVGLTLSGWCMYLLARDPGDPLDARPPVTPIAAFVAGLIFLMWPIHLVALYGHLEKLFVGLLPLNVLAALRAYDPARSPRWLIAPGITLLLILLQNGNQFTFALAAVVLLAVIGVWRRWRRGDALRPYMRRVVSAGAIAVVITAPLLVEIADVMNRGAFEVTLGALAGYYSPDLLQFLVPSIHQLVGVAFYPHYEFVVYDFTRQSVFPSLTPRPGWVGSGIETAVTIPITAIVLMAIAWRAAAWRRSSRVWLLFGVVFTVLAMGPVLRILGWTLMPMPYRLLAQLPAFNVMRTPGRFMMIASVGFALAAAYGFAALVARWPHRARLLGAVTIALVLIEGWPRPWMQQLFPPIPAFYRTIAQDPEHYAVLDLPSGRWSPSAASAYQYYQLTHRKPIAWGYLSRQFTTYPIGGLSGILVDTAPNPTGTRERLVRLGYRFVVWHKRADELFGDRRPERVGDGRFREGPVDAQTNAFVRKAFEGEQPIVDDDLVTVYRLDPRPGRAPGM